MNSGNGSLPALGGCYRDALTAASARIEALERWNRALVEENHALLERLTVPGPSVTTDEALTPVVRRRAIRRSIRALRRELRAVCDVRRRASRIVLAVAAAAAFMVVVAFGSMGAWLLAAAIVGIGTVARSFVAHGLGFDDWKERRRKLANVPCQMSGWGAMSRRRRLGRGAVMVLRA